MSRNYKFHNHDGINFISFASVYWIDVFIRPLYKNILVDSINYCIREKKLNFYAWVIMSSHVHMIISTKKERLSEIIRDLKKHTSKEIINAIKDNIQESIREWVLWMFERVGKKNGNNKKYQFWQQHNHTIELDNNLVIEQKLSYLNDNPVKEGSVFKASEYAYSSAIDYNNGKGYINIMKIN